MPDMNMNDNHYPHANFPLPNPPSALPNLTLDTGMSRTRDLVSGEYCQECLYTVEVPESVHAPFRSYYHEGLGSVFSVHDTPQANAFAPLESHSAMVRILITVLRQNVVAVDASCVHEYSPHPSNFTCPSPLGTS